MRTTRDKVRAADTPLPWGGGGKAPIAAAIVVICSIHAGCGSEQSGDADIDLKTGSTLVYEVKEPEPQPGPGTDPEPATGSDIDPDAPNAVHPFAKRSAFPEAGEAFDKPIEIEPLSDLDPFAPTIDPADIPAIVPWDEARKYVGYEITVEGTVVTVGRSRDGRVNFLNFHKDWRGKFYMVIFDDLAQTLDASVKDLFTGKKVRVEGLVDTHRGRPQIKIESMDQVRFVEP